MGDRRPSLIDQMAMAAALESFVDSDQDSDHEEDGHVDDEREGHDDDEDYDSSSGNTEEYFMRVGGGRVSNNSRLSGASSRFSGTSRSSLSSAGSNMRLAAAAATQASRVSYLGRRQSTDIVADALMEEFGDDDYEDSYNDTDGDREEVEIGRYGPSNEFILDEDIVNAAKYEFPNQVQDAIVKQNLAPGLHRASNDGRDHGEHLLYEKYDQPIQSGVYPGYDQLHGRMTTAAEEQPQSHSNRLRDNDDHSEIGSAPSRNDSEAFDLFDDEQIIHQQFGKGDAQAADIVPTSSGSEGVGVSALDPLRRHSFNQHRRTSYNSAHSDHSLHSAPSPYEYGTAEGGANGTERRRPVSITVPATEGTGYRRRRSARNSASVRRQSVQIRGGTKSASTPSGSFIGEQRRPSYSANEDEESGTSNSGANSGSISSAVGLLMFRNRRSRHMRQSLSFAAKQGPLSNLENAIDTLRNQDSNNEWETVAAAVTVVAASEAGASASKSQHNIKFAVNDTVLVFLTLLNVTNMEDPKDTFTVAPVNKYGFPAGEGRKEAEKLGPYTFVLCRVVHVHFDEDDRYYTVERADTGTHQRADSGWMEPINDPAGIHSAMQAAKKTVRSTQDKPEEVQEETGFLQSCMDTCMSIISWPSNFLMTTVLPFYHRLRLATKILVSNFLLGDAPFSCKVRVTGINLLVLCSIAFLFLEVINLGFLPASLDDEMAIIGTVVWIVLAVELIFEVIIRPNNYYKLIKSDKAFAPSTARYISSFHLFFEVLALFTYIPEFGCAGDSESCTRGELLSRVSASASAILGPTHGDAAWGRFKMGLTSLRFFGVIRHWKQMWINNTFHPVKREGIEKWLFPREKEVQDTERIRPIFNRQKRRKHEDETYDDDTTAVGSIVATKMTNSEEDQRLKNAATIGTALMVVNSQRALILMVLVVIILPLLQAINQQNLVSDNLTSLLQNNNMVALSGITDCEYLELTVESWLNMAAVPQPPSALESIDFTFVLWAQVLPVRCPFQKETGVITSCMGRLSKYRDMPVNQHVCDIWDTYSPSSASEATPAYFANVLNLRQGGIVTKFGTALGETENIEALSSFNVTVVYNENPTISLANMGLFYLLLSILILGLYFLQALRGDAIGLVLDPLQRMLKIVLRYAENPLSQDVNKKSQQEKLDDESAIENDGEEIGNFETEQLINAITKIADLLRKCWGVAGAGIISSNLARTKDGKTVVFNPTVPGKRVYALFGFVAINGFSEILRSLDRDIMILINDVAKVVHDEVYRWALGEHGQCNKNLGPAFLMVWRIGDFSEVHKKKQVATEKLFRDNATKPKRSTLRRRNLGRALGRRGRNSASSREIQLESLPGIQAFTDRALLGMLKSFAGIHRDKRLTNWKNDFRLSAGVGAYHADIMYGMDAGWAVEGAVGSEYKIDATYLSPHVNMASRMMSATKQYGVTILLSKAVEKLLSKNCRKKLRHLDTVYVKGSNVKQDIFTYDARFQGVDFFLLERTEDQADLEAEMYTPNIWDQDQDLRAMRQHVSDAFMDTYHLGVKQYLAGNWEEAYTNFQAADSLMIETVLEDGYLEIDVDEIEGRIFNLEDKDEDIVRLRIELGDGACRTLMNFMKRRNLMPPNDWDAVRQLFSK